MGSRKQERLKKFQQDGHIVRVSNFDYGLWKDRLITASRLHPLMGPAEQRI